MILWTIQNRSAFNYLRTQGSLNAVLPDDSEHNLVVAHKWITVELNSFTQVACNYPIWAWSRFDGSKSRPDLRLRWHLPRGTPGCLLEIEIPESELLLSQFEMWVWVMNGKHVPVDSDEEKWLFNQSKRLSQKSLAKKKIESWKRIFDLDSGCEEFWGPRKSRAIQACFPVLNLKQVISVKMFTAR